MAFFHDKERSYERTKEPIPLIDYESMLYCDFYPYLTYTTFPALYITNSTSLRVNCTQSLPVTKTMAGVHVDDWGEDSIDVTLSGIVAPMRHQIKNLVKDPKEMGLKQAASAAVSSALKKLNPFENAPTDRRVVMNKSDPILDEYRAHSYNGFAEFYGSSGPDSLFGFKYWEQFLAFWRSNATLYNRDNLPVAHGNIVLYTEYSYDNLPDARDNPGAVNTKFFRPNDAFNKDKEPLDVPPAGSPMATPKLIFIGNLTSFTFQEDSSSPYKWTINLGLKARFHIVIITRPSMEAKKEQTPPTLTDDQDLKVTSYTRARTSIGALSDA